MNDCGPDCGDVCDECCDGGFNNAMPDCGNAGSNGWGQTCGHPSVITDSAWTSAFAVGAPAFQLFGNIANFCVAPLAMGPPEIPPPGRFHPVPTTPVFAPAR